MQAASSAWIWEKKINNTHRFTDLRNFSVPTSLSNCLFKTPKKRGWNAFCVKMALISSRWGPVSETLRHRWERWDWMILVSFTRVWRLGFFGPNLWCPENWKNISMTSLAFLNKNVYCFFLHGRLGKKTRLNSDLLPHEFTARRSFLRDVRYGEWHTKKVEFGFWKTLDIEFPKVSRFGTSARLFFLPEVWFLYIKS